VFIKDGVTKKEGEMIFGVEILNIVTINSIRFAGIFRKTKNNTTSMGS
jgi:hypothetical protein